MIGRVGICFLPEQFRARQARQHGALLFFGMLVLMCGGASVLWWLSRASVHRVEAERAAVNREYAELLITAARIHEANRQEQTLARQVEWAAAVTDRVPRSCVLAEIAAATPGGVSFNELTLDSQGTSQDQSEEVTLRLKGAAASEAAIEQLLFRLNRSSLFTDVNRVGTPQAPRWGDVDRAFEIELSLNPSADMSAETARTRSQVVLLNPD